MPIGKILSAVRIVFKNGGLFKSLGKMWRFDTLKDGKLVGTDCFGNMYYENDYYMIPRNRWVEIYKNANWDYDASMIPAHWFGWLHNKTDRLPCQDPAKLTLYACPLNDAWLMQHQENLTGTPCAYYPYSTVPPSIHVWDGSVSKRPSD